MRLRPILLSLALLMAGSSAFAQFMGDVAGVHNFGPGSKSPITGGRTDFCSDCHAPHSGQDRGLWNQTLTTQSYAVYTSGTEANKGTQPSLGEDSNLCLSCHDGTVGVGTTTAYGQVSTQGSMYKQDVFGNNMQPSHPFSLALPLQDNVDLISTLIVNGVTGDSTGSVKLVNGNIECTSCHEPHVQARDPISPNFLVMNSANGAMCLACHDPTRQMSGKLNPLAGWATSAHASSPARIAPTAGVGSYPTMAATACIGCHAPHNGSGSSRLLRGQNEQDCIPCHNGGSNVSPAAPNIFSEYVTPKIGHPFPSSTNAHDASEAILLNNNRHATCVDCHSGHGSQAVTTFPPPPSIRLSQQGVAGINALDGNSVLNPAVNQFENCLRCHGSSSGKQILPIYGYAPVRLVSNGDPLNVIPQLSLAASSSHPVIHARSSALPQPSLLLNMLNLDGITQGRAMGTQILCTDCHNSDDNREFGNGPEWPTRLQVVTYSGAAI